MKRTATITFSRLWVGGVYKVREEKSKKKEKQKTTMYHPKAQQTGEVYPPATHTTPPSPKNQANAAMSPDLFASADSETPWGPGTSDPTIDRTHPHDFDAEMLVLIAGLCDGVTKGMGIIKHSV